MEVQLPEYIMRKAVKGISYIAHPLRLRILEYLDVNGSSSVSTITKALGEEQVIISQSLKKMREANLVKTTRRGIFIYYDICEEYPASIFTCLRKLYAMMTDNFYFLEDGVKAILPSDYTMMTANRIKLFANYDKMRILEILTLRGSMNVTDIDATPVHIAYEQVCRKARDRGVEVTGSELIGLLPKRVLTEAGKYYGARSGLPENMKEEELIELAVTSLRLADLAPFDYRKRVIEYLI